MAFLVIYQTVLVLMNWDAGTIIKKSFHISYDSSQVGRLLRKLEWELSESEH